MADVPFYMQGSQTGGILQGLSSPQGSQEALNAAIQAAQPYGQAAVQAAVAAHNNGQTYDPATGKTGPVNSFNSSNYPTGSTPLSGYTSPQGTPAPAAPAATDSSMNIIGQSNPWLSPEEMRAKNNALQDSSSPSISGGGGNSSGSASASAAPDASGGGGLNLSGIGENPGGANGGNPNFTPDSNTPISPTIGYQDPGGVASTPTVNYQGAPQGGTQGQQGVLQMQSANPQAALDQYKSTPGYQLLNSPGAYQQSPGYQYAMDQALGQVQNNASARGMLESGAVLKSMQQTASGLAQQDYGNWWNRQNQLYGDYQNRLQGLAGGPTGSADAMTAGANGAQASLQTGSNLGSLFGNQGTTGMGGIINTGAAQSGNMINAGQQQASVNAANQATQLAGATLANQQQKTNGLF